MSSSVTTNARMTSVNPTSSLWFIHIEKWFNITPFWIGVSWRLSIWSKLSNSCWITSREINVCWEVWEVSSGLLLRYPVTSKFSLGFFSDQLKWCSNIKQVTSMGNSVRIKILISKLTYLVKFLNAETLWSSLSLWIVTIYNLTFNFERKWRNVYDD